MDFPSFQCKVQCMPHGGPYSEVRSVGRSVLGLLCIFPLFWSTILVLEWFCPLLTLVLPKLCRFNRYSLLWYNRLSLRACLLYRGGPGGDGKVWKSCMFCFAILCMCWNIFFCGETTQGNLRLHRKLRLHIKSGYPSLSALFHNCQLTGNGTMRQH